MCAWYQWHSLFWKRKEFGLFTFLWSYCQERVLSYSLSSFIPQRCAPQIISILCFERIWDVFLLFLLFLFIYLFLSFQLKNECREPSTFLVYKEKKVGRVWVLFIFFFIPYCWEFLAFHILVTCPLRNGWLKSSTFVVIKVKRVWIVQSLLFLS